MMILTETARSEYTTSTIVNATLEAIIVMQGTELPDATTQKDIAHGERQKRAGEEKIRKEALGNNVSCCSTGQRERGIQLAIS